MQASTIVQKNCSLNNCIAIVNNFAPLNINDNVKLNIIYNKGKIIVNSLNKNKIKNLEEIIKNISYELNLGFNSLINDHNKDISDAEIKSYIQRRLYDIKQIVNHEKKKIDSYKKKDKYQKAMHKALSVYNVREYKKLLEEKIKVQSKYVETYEPTHLQLADDQFILCILEANDFNYLQAIELAKKAIYQNPSNSIYLIYLGRLYFTIGKYVQAEHYYTESINIVKNTKNSLKSFDIIDAYNDLSLV